MSLRTLRMPLVAHAVLAAAFVLTLTLGAGALWPALAQSPGATILVNSTADTRNPNDGLCTLREALIAANSNAASGSVAGECRAGTGDDVVEAPPGTYRLTIPNFGQEEHALAGDLDITAPLTIRPSAPGLVVISIGDIAHRIFEVKSAGATIEGVTLRDGASLESGGAIWVDAGASIRLENVTLVDNGARYTGGAIAGEGDVTIVNSTIDGNESSRYAAIDVSGSVSIGNTIIGANDSDSGADCRGTFSGSGANIALDASCAAGSATQLVDPQLIADRDGNNKVVFYRIAETSPALDAGTGTICPATDQQGAKRPQRRGCDIGAYELPGTLPTAISSTLSTPEDTPVTVTLSGTTDVGDSLQFTITTQPIHGALSVPINTGDTTATATYAPSANYYGGDSVVFFVSNSLGASQPATVTIQVTPVNDPPVAVGDSLTTAEDAAQAVQVSANDSDVDGNLNPDSVTIETAPAKGTATPTGGGNVNYVPNANATGGDSFTYRICDTENACTTASVTVTITPANDPPTATGDAYTLAEDTALNIAAPGVLQNDGDPDGDALTAALLTQAGHGTATVQGNGAFTYTPAKHYDGSDSFTYSVSDGKGGATTATVNLTITPDALFEVTNVADSGAGSLREAMLRANAEPNLSTIVFDITGAGPHQINLLSQLPPIASPVLVDGASQPQGAVVVDGGNKPFPCFVILSGGSGSTIQGLTIQHCGAHAIVVDRSGGNTIQNNILQNNTGDGIHIVGDSNDLGGSGGNTIANNQISGNGGNGITIIDSVDNNLVNNSIFGNSGQPVDLGGDGPTPNDPGDTDTGANYKQNYPVLMRSVPADITVADQAQAASAAQAGAITGQLVGWLNTRPNDTFTLRVYAAPSCGDAQQRLLTTTPSSVTTDAEGNAYFALQINSPIAVDEVVRATATDGTGNTSEYSDCIVTSIDNDSWPRALALDALGASVEVQQYLDMMGQARWYRFRVQPHSQVQVTLTDLPANYDLTLYKDIAKTYEKLTTDEDTVQMSAEFAPQAFSPQAFSPQAFSSSAFSPQAFSPQAFSPQAFSPQAFSPQAFSPQAFSPQAFSPQAFSPQAFSPQAFSPQAFSPQAFSSDAYLPAVLDPESFSGAQTRSIVGVSAFDGAASEGILINTWLNDADFYVRVRGREGDFSLDAPYRLTVQVTPGPCETMMALPALPATSLVAPAGSAKSAILVDAARLRARYPAAEVDALLAQLANLAARPEVGGTIIDVGQDARVAAANARADLYNECVYAKNLVVEAIKSVVDRYRANNPLHYVVLVGNDDLLPFYRYPDNALLGHESDYVPPVLDQTSSQASLRLGYVLSQDIYGSRVQVSLNATEFPVPDLPVGRLVETPSDIRTLLDAYLSTANGVAPTPTSSLVTGYDFLEDAANAVRDELAAGIGVAPETLITAKEISPLDARSWTAEQLRAKLDKRNDIVYLAGHFNAASALAADYRTSYLSTDLLASPANMTNALFFSAGCHSGYNIVNAHGVPGVTFEPDWAQVFARRGATLIAGTGYQYGDTDFIEYSERLYLEFTRQLRKGTGPVAVGDALVAAKQRYLATTPALKGAHEKSVLEATLFGLPMFAIQMPGQRWTPAVETPAIASLNPVSGNPGETLGLLTADLSVKPNLATRTLELRNVVDDATVVSTWLEGDDGVVTNPAQPATPLVVRNVSVPDHLLRGVGLRSATYVDTPNITPLTGAPVTELRGVHSPFQSDVFFPPRPWGVNFFELLMNGQDEGVTRFNVMPAQYRSSAPGSQTSTQRHFSQMDFRLYYVEDTAAASGATAAGAGIPLSLLADMPTIVRVEGVVLTDTVEFRALVVANPAVGIQNVWVTYTAIDGPLHGKWQSLDLVQHADDSTLWTARLPLGGQSALSLRYIVQAVNGLGMVGLVDNIGRYYTPGVEGVRAATVLELDPLVGESSATGTSGAFGTTVQFGATLKRTDGTPLAGQPVTFGVGPQTRLALTDATGRAQTSIPLLGMPGSYPVQTAFAGTAELESSSSTSPNLFTIERQSSTLTLEPAVATGRKDPVTGIVPAGTMTATLMDAAGRRLVEQTVFFVIEPLETAAGATPSMVQPVITNLVGEARLSALDLPAQVYRVSVAFDGAVSHGPSSAQGTLSVYVPTADDDIDEPSAIRLFLPVVDR